MDKVDVIIVGGGLAGLSCAYELADSGMTVIVLERGDAFLGKWVSEKRDVLADYHRLFGGNGDAPVARGIAILTDADNTASRASGDYGDIDILR